MQNKSKCLYFNVFVCCRNSPTISSFLHTAIQAPNLFSKDVAIVVSLYLINCDFFYKLFVFYNRLSTSSFRDQVHDIPLRTVMISHAVGSLSSCATGAFEAIISIIRRLTPSSCTVHPVAACIVCIPPPCEAQRSVCAYY